VNENDLEIMMWNDNKPKQVRWMITMLMIMTMISANERA
jgi:hypothetical protein